MCAVTCACTATYPTEATNTKTVAIQIGFPARGRVTPGTNNAFSVTAIDSDGVYQVVTSRSTWTSSNESVARPTAPGAFVAGAPGTAWVTASYEGFQATAPLAVVESQSLQVFPRLFVNPVGPGATGLTASAQALLRLTNSNSQNVTNSTSWASSDPNIATVDANGRITGRGPGTALITATYQDLSDWFWVSIGPS